MKRFLTILLLTISITAFSQNRAVLRAVEISRQQATPSNLYTLANAARPTPNEVNAATGFSIVTGTGTIESSNTGATATNGSYFLKQTHTGANNTSVNGRASLTLVVGQSYTMYFDANRIARPFASGNAFIQILSSSFSILASQILPTSTPGWNSYSYTFTPTGTGVVYININMGSTTGTGDIVGLDNIRIIKS